MGRVTATVLFTDLVGSTDLRARLGEEPADELIGRHDRALTDAVEAHGGRVVKGLGDGIMATFAGAADAVAAAVAIQQGIDRLNRTARTPAALSVRVGLSAGDVAVDDDDVQGTPVIEAARLCAEAAGGEILASEVVRWLGGTAGAAALTPVGSLDLKGLPVPVPAVRVEWDPAPTSPVPLPALLRGAGRIFVGRDGELERLGQLWKEAVAGERRVALVAGEPGIGKTRLAAMAARAAHEGGGVVLAGRCDEDLGVPYQPFVEALRHYVVNAGSELRLGRHGGELVRLVPEVAEVTSGLPAPLRSDPETERYRLFDAVAAWLADVSAEVPLLLVADDLQWAAKPTLLLLRHVLRGPEAMALLVVATYRDTDVGRGHPLSEFLADLRREAGVERLSLVGLDGSAVADYLVQASGHDLDPAGEELARAVWRETEGLPFFVVEVIRHLVESGGVEQRDGRWVVAAGVEELGIPEGVRDVVGRRLSRLSEDANRVLACASVAGLEFEPAVVQAAGEFEEATVISALDQAVASRLVVEVSGPVPRNRFSHALVRATLYDELTATGRVAWHRKVAEAIEALHAEALDDHLPALAHHWSRASGPTADTKAVEYTTRAGDRALAQLAYDEAVRYFQQALELLGLVEGVGDEDRRLELLIGLGEAQRRAGDPASRTTLLDAGELARQLGRGEAMARAALANNRGTFSVLGIVDTDRVEVLEEALAAPGDTDPARRARLLGILAVELLWSADQARCRRLSDEALTLARRTGDPRTLGSVIALRWATLWDPRWAVERLHLAEELLSLADVTADPSLKFWGLWRRSLALMELGDTAAAGESREASQRQAEDLGQPFLSWCVQISQIPAAVASGRLGDAEKAIGAVPGFRIPDADTLHAAALAALHYEYGRLGELETILLSTVEELPRVPLFRGFLALAYLERGRLADAHSTYESLGDNLAELIFDYYAAPTAAVLATVCSQVGDTRGAAGLYDLLGSYANQVASHPDLWFGSYSHHLGLLSTTLDRLAEAGAHFATAAQSHERLGATSWLARTRLEWARMLLTRRQAGDEKWARGLLGQALATARELGLANVERRAVVLLEQA